MGRRSLLANGSKTTRIEPSHLVHKNGRIKKPRELDMSQRVVMKPTSVYCRSPDDGGGTCKSTSAISEGRRTFMHLRPHKMYTPLIGLSRRRVKTGMNHAKASAADTHLSGRDSLSLQKMHPPASHAQGRSSGAQEKSALKRVRKSETLLETSRTTTASSNGRKNHCKGKRSQHVKQATLTCHRAWQPPSYSRLLQTMGNHRLSVTLQPLPSRSDKQHVLEASNGKASRSADTDTEANGMKTKCQQIKVEPNINSNCAQWQTGKQRLATDMLPKNSLSRQNSQLKSKEESERTHKTAMLLRSNKKYVSVFQRKPRRSATARVSLGCIASDDQSSNCQLNFKDLQSSPSVERQTPEKQENVNEASAASLTSPEQCTTIQSPKCVLSNITPTFAMESKCNVEPTTQEVEQSSNRRVLNSGEERGSLAVLQNERGSSQGSQRIQQTDSGSLQSENKQSVMSAGELQNTLENGQVDNEKSSVLPKSQVDHKQHSTHQKLDIGDISTHGEPEISKLGGSNFALRNLLTLRPYSSYRLMAGKQLLCATKRRHWLLTQPGCRSLYHVDDYAPKVLMRLQPYTRYRRVVNKPQLHETKSRHWFLVQGVSVHSRQTMETIPDNLCKAQELSESLKSGTCSNLSNPNLPAENTPEEDLKAVESNEFEVDESPQSIKESGSEMVLVETSTPQLTKAGELDGSLSQETKLTTKHCAQKRSRQKLRKSAKNNCHAASKSFKGVKKEQSNTNHTSASKPCRSEQIIETEENVSGQSCMAQNIASGQSCESPIFSTSIIDVPEIALSHNTGQRDEDADSHQAVSPAQDIVLTSTDASIQIKTKSVPDCNPKIRMMMRPYPAYQKVAGKSMLQCKFTGHWLLTEVQGIDFKHEKVDNMVRNAEQKSDSLLAIKAVESNEFEVDESPQNTNPNAPAGKTPEEVLLPVELSNPSEILLPQHIKAVESNEFEVNESPLNIKLSGSEKTLEETSAPQPTKAGELDGSLSQETELTTKPCTRKGSRQKRRKSAKNNHHAVSKSFKGVKKEQSITDHTSTSPKPCRSEEIIETEENVSGQSSMAQNIVIGQSCESPTSMLSKSPIDVQEHSLNENSHQKDNDADFLRAVSPAQDIAPSSSDASIQIKTQSVSDYSPKILMMMRPYPAYQKVAGNSMLPCKFTGHWFLTEVQGSDFKHEKVDDVVRNAEQKSDGHLAITAVESNEFEVDESPQNTNPNASVEKTPEEVLLPAELSNPLEMLLQPQHIKAVESNELEVDKSPQNTKQSGSEKALEETPVPQLTKAGELDGSLSPETKLTTKQCTQKGSSKKRRKSAKNKYHAASKSLNGVKKEQSIMDHTSKSPKSGRSEETVEAEKIVSGQSCMAQNIVSGQSCENPMLSKSVTHASSQNTRQRVKDADSLHLGKTVQTRSLTQKLERPKRRLKPTEKSLLHQLAKAVKTCRHSAKPTLKLKTVRKPTKKSPKPEFGKKSLKSKYKQRAVLATKILVPSRQSSGPDLRAAATCTEREPDSTHPSLLQETSDKSVSVIQSQVGLSQGLGDCLKVNKVTGDKKATLAKQNRLHKVCLDIQVRGLSQLHHLISIANQISTMPSAIPDSDTTSGNDKLTTEEQCTDSEVVLDSKPQVVDTMQVDDTRESTCVTDVVVSSPCLSTMPSVISDSDTTLGNDNQTTEEQCTESEAVLDSRPQAVDTMQLDDTKESTCVTDVAVSSPCLSTMLSVISDPDTTLGNDNLTSEEQCTDGEAVLDSKPQAVDTMQVDNTNESTCTKDVTVSSPCLSTMPSVISDSDTTLGNDNQSTEEQYTDSEAVLNSKPQAVDTLQLDDTKQSTCATDVSVSSPCLSTMPSAISDSDTTSGNDNLTTEEQCTDNDSEAVLDSKSRAVDNMQLDDTKESTCATDVTVSSPCLSHMESEWISVEDISTTDGMQSHTEKDHNSMPEQEERQDESSRDILTEDAANITIETNKCQSFADSPNPIISGKEEDKKKPRTGAFNFTKGSQAKPRRRTTMRLRKKDKHFLFSRLGFKKTKRRAFHVVHNNKHGRGRKPLTVRAGEKDICEQGKGLNEHGAEISRGILGDPGSSAPPSCTHRLRKRRANAFRLTHVMFAAASQKPSPSANPKTKPTRGRPRKPTHVMFEAASRKPSLSVDPNTKPTIGRPRKLTHVMPSAALQKPSPSADPNTKSSRGRQRKPTHVMFAAASQKHSSIFDPNTKPTIGRPRKPTRVMFAAASKKPSSIADPNTKPSIGRPRKLTHVMSAAASQKPSSTADPTTKPTVGRQQKPANVMFAAASQKHSSIADPNTKPAIGRPRKPTHAMSAAASQKPSPSADPNTKSIRGRPRKPTHAMFAAASQKHSSIADPNTKPTIGRPRKLTDVMFAAASQKHSSIADPNTKPTIGRPRKQTHVMSATASQKPSPSVDPNTQSSRGRPRKPTHVMFASASQKHSSIVKPNTKPTIGRPQKLTHVMSAAASQKRSPSADPNTKSTIGRPRKLTHVMSAAASQKPLPSADPDTKSRRGRPWKPTHVMFAAASQKHSSIADPYTKPTRGRPRKPTDVMFAAASQKASPSADPNTKPTRSRPRKRKLSPHENSSPTNSILPSLHTCRRGKEFCTTEQPSNVQLDLQHHSQKNSRSLKLQDSLDHANSDALSKPRGRKRKKRVFPKRKGDLQSPVTNLSRDAPPACMPASSPDHLPPAKRIKQLIPGYVSPDKEEFTLEEFCSLKTLEEAVEMAARETRNDELPHLSPVSRRKMKSSDSKLHGVSSSLNKKSRAKRSSRSPEGSYWDCSVCTYRNKAEAFKCAMCDVRKGTSTRKPRLNAQLVAQQQAQQNLSPLVHVKPVKPAPRSSPVQRKTGTPKKPRPRLKNIDRSSAISTEVVVNNVPVIITEYKEKSHTRTTVDSDEASADRTNGNVNGL